MLAAGERMPDATVRLESRERLELPALLAEGPILLFFYLFDWSST